MFALTKISGNVKTGPIATSMTSEITCPDACPLKRNGCYAAYGNTNIHWKRITEGKRGVDADQFLREVSALPGGSMFRHNVAGDLPHNNQQIDEGFAIKLAKSAKRLRGFTYTHHTLSEHNVNVLKKMNALGFTANISANSIKDVPAYKATGLPVVTMLAIDAPNVQHVEGIKVVACPAEKSDKVQCISCGICAKADRDYVIGFRAHGTAKNKANIIAVG